ncbi:MAG: S41 family peptidase [Thiotrichales bacterium]|jgi:carboxyl-terminal processing protease|nr:S41 family peptidase [Thiotrichales bacterium]
MANKKSLWVALGFSVGIIVAGSASVLADKVGSKAEATSEGGLPLAELRAFAEVFERIGKDYVEPVDDKALLENAIDGMLSNLDPHSAYLKADSFKDMEETTKGEFGGVGMEVGMEDGFIKVIAPIDDTPANKAGIKAGDLVVRIDDVPVKGLTLQQAVDKLRGKAGTDVQLTVMRKSEDKPLIIKLTRAVIKVNSVKQRLLSADYGYVRISQFQVKTGTQLVDAIDKLTKENTRPLKGLVLDLRNNPGGVLNAAVEVSDALLDKGLIVYTEGRVKDSDMRFSATKGDVLNGAPVVVLINEGSASASEIVAGALQDNGRALIAGRTSFGKGSVQSVIPLQNGAAIKLTTARYFTPAGRSIQAEGITPDVKIEQVKVDLVDKSLERVKEADLSRHLANPKDDKDGKAAAKAVDKDKADTNATDAKPEDALVSKDYELYEAQNLLKAMAMSKR